MVPPKAHALQFHCTSPLPTFFSRQTRWRARKSIRQHRSAARKPIADQIETDFCLYLTSSLYNRLVWEIRWKRKTKGRGEESDNTPCHRCSNLWQPKDLLKTIITLHAPSSDKTLANLFVAGTEQMQLLKQGTRFSSLLRIWAGSGQAEEPMVDHKPKHWLLDGLLSRFILCTDAQ